MSANVAVIGFGEVGQLLADDLSRVGLSNVTAYDILFSQPGSIPARSQVPVRKCASAREAVIDRDLVISAVTAASDLEAARAVALAIPKDAFFLDINSVSPDQKRAAAKIINGAGGRYVEGVVMSPFAPKRIASPILLGGPHASTFLATYAGLGFSGTTVFSGDYGKASATKMCRSLIIKGTESLLLESLLAARHYGVESEVLASLSDLLPIADWNKLATYMISRSLEHGARRAEEMREVAGTVAAVGFKPLMSLACAARQDWAAPLRGAICGNLGVMLDTILTSDKLNSDRTGHAA